eukprot:3379259-Rhodomonas_salina.1
MRGLQPSARRVRVLACGTRVFRFKRAHRMAHVLCITWAVTCVWSRACGHVHRLRISSGDFGANLPGDGDASEAVSLGSVLIATWLQLRFRVCATHTPAVEAAADAGAGGGPCARALNPQRGSPRPLPGTTRSTSLPRFAKGPVLVYPDSRKAQYYSIPKPRVQLYPEIKSHRARPSKRRSSTSSRYNSAPEPTTLLRNRTPRIQLDKSLPQNDKPSTTLPRTLAPGYAHRGSDEGYGATSRPTHVFRLAATLRAEEPPRESRRRRGRGGERRRRRTWGTCPSETLSAAP